MILVALTQVGSQCQMDQEGVNNLNGHPQVLLLVLETPIWAMDQRQEEQTEYHLLQVKLDYLRHQETAMKIQTQFSMRQGVPEIIMEQ